MTTEPSAVPPPSGRRFDVIVVGGGVIGLAAACQAAVRGLDVLLLEQFADFGDGRASSSGASRMFRLMHSSAPMAKLAQAALTLWHELETAEGEAILRKQPLTFYGERSGPTVEGDLGAMPQTMSDLVIPFDVFATPDALMQRYPAFKAMPDTYVGMTQPDSAVIRVDAALSAFRRQATRAGAVLLTGQRAAVTVDPRGQYQVSCAAGSYGTPRLILCPGAWTNHVLRPFGIALELTIWQMTVGYFKADTDRYDYPLWYEFGARPGPGEPQLLFYGFPCDEVAGALKLGADYTNATFSDPEQCSHRPDRQILAEIAVFAQSRFHGIDPIPLSASACLYTMSPDAQMVLDRLPGHPGVAIFTGDSGRGFKFAPWCGRALVDLVTTGRAHDDIRLFAIDRAGIVRSTSGRARHHRT
jgi:monomeric sarcosine oxidase